MINTILAGIRKFLYLKVITKAISYSIFFFLTILITYNLINIRNLNVDMSYYAIKSLKNNKLSTLLKKNSPTFNRYNLYNVLAENYRGHELLVESEFPDSLYTLLKSKLPYFAQISVNRNSSNKDKIFEADTSRFCKTNYYDKIFYVDTMQAKGKSIFLIELNNNEFIISKFSKSKFSYE